MLRFGGVKTSPQIRNAGVEDAERIAAIYSHHVLHGTASYDTEPPSVDEIRGKIGRIRAKGWPFLVAITADEVAGYAYATQFRDRAAYRFTCENSIYVDPGRLGRGIGKALLAELCSRAAACGFRQMVAVIGGAEPASVALHRGCGFEEAGRLRSVGWKHGRWLDNVYMQKSIGSSPSTSSAGPPRPAGEE